MGNLFLNFFYFYLSNSNRTRFKLFDVIFLKLDYALFIIFNSFSKYSAGAISIKKKLKV